MKSIAVEFEPIPSQTTSIIISETKTKKDTPIHVFNIAFDGKLVVYYDWPGDIGSSCTSVFLNFWSIATLSEENQTQFGDIGYMRILRCIESKGNVSYIINSTASDSYNVPMAIYFELDNDLSFTGAIQDNIYLIFEFYPFKGQQTTQNAAIQLPVLILSTALITAALSLRRKRLKR